MKTADEIAAIEAEQVRVIYAYLARRRVAVAVLPVYHRLAKA